MPSPSSSARFLSARARVLNAAARAGRVPALYFFTDPARTPEPERIAAQLPKGTAIVYRHFGAKDRTTRARALARIARTRGLVLLIGNDEALAARVGADGVHLPERALGRLQTLRQRRPRWLITIAAHDGGALVQAARRGADAAILSPLLPSRSASAGAPLGARQGAALARRAALSVIGLGGIDARTRTFARPGLAGIAAIDGLSRV